MRLGSLIGSLLRRLIRWLLALFGLGPARPRRGPPHPVVGRTLRAVILERDRFRCVLCGASPATDPACRLHVDHVVPASWGGPATPANLRTLCADCNLGRGSRGPGDAAGSTWSETPPGARGR